MMSRGGKSAGVRVAEQHYLIYSTVRTELQEGDCARSDDSALLLLHRQHRPGIVYTGGAYFCTLCRCAETDADYVVGVNTSAQPLLHWEQASFQFFS